MPLPPPTAARLRIHQRSITFQGFRRDDGLWDIEGRLVDTKDQPFPILEDVRQPGEPVHDISVRITIDTQMNVLDVAWSADATPFPGTCDAGMPDYRKIIGLNLFKGFVKAVKNKFGERWGCTHATELLMSMPTAAFQTFAGQVKHEERGHGDQVPFHLDRCHALRRDSPVVRHYYPRWYLDPASECDELPTDK